MQKERRNKTKTTQAVIKQNEPPFLIELSLDDNVAFLDVLLEAIDKTFLDLGEPVKKSIYCYLEKLGIKKHEIPFRIDDFQKALEGLFGVGARQLEIFIIKNLHDKIKIKYNKDMPYWMIPELTFREYIRQVKASYENST
jgi:hypothetical protein